MGASAASRLTAGRGVGPTISTIALLSLLHASNALAFPLLDPTNQDTAPGVTDLAAPDAQDLKHQLQVVNGLPAPGGALGWTILPRLGLQEALTDNILQQHSPRRWDLTTYLSPGIAIAGNTNHAQVRLDYSPVLIMNARTGSQNALNQQLNGTASVTAIDEWAFIDLRAVSGVQTTNGRGATGGGIGTGELGGIGGGTGGGTTTGATGTSRQNEVQTTSFGISPYLLHRFGDYGTVKLGYSLNLSNSTPVTGFKYLPFPTGGGGSNQKQTSREQILEYKSGEFLGSIQDTLSVNFTQSNGTSTTAGNGFFATAQTTPALSTASVREIITNTISYAVNRTLTLNAMVGHERIKYSGANVIDIDDITWTGGATITPNADSAVTFTYGHQEGSETFSFDGHYQISARTTLSANYNESLGTQLENLQQQLNRGTVSANGGFVNSSSGGSLFAASNATPVQSGVFRTRTLTATGLHRFDRDTVTLVLTATDTSRAGTTTTAAAAANQISFQTKSASLQWVWELRPDLTLSNALSYNITTGGAGLSSRSIAFNTSVQYALSPTVSTTVRYSFYQSTSSNPLFDLYANLLIVGVSKTF